MPGCPVVAEELRQFAALLERHYADLCDIEFTIEDGRLWMLQVRAGKKSPRAALRIAAEMADDPTFPLSKKRLCAGCCPCSPIRRASVVRAARGRGTDLPAGCLHRPESLSGSVGLTS